MATTLSNLFEKLYKQMIKKETEINEKTQLEDMQNLVAQLRADHQKLLNELQKLVREKQKEEAAAAAAQQPKQAAPPPKKPKPK